MQALFRRVAEARSDEVLLTRCAWCERVRVAPDEWVDVADEAAEGQALLARASHGICPSCLARISAQRDAAAGVERRQPRAPSR